MSSRRVTWRSIVPPMEESPTPIRSPRCPRNSVDSTSGYVSPSTTTPIPTKPTSSRNFNPRENGPAGSRFSSDFFRRLGVFGAHRSRVGHANQGSLGERDIKQGGGGRQRRAESNMVDEQEWRARPQLIQREDGEEDPREFLPQPRVVKNHRRKQIKTHRDAHGRGDENHNQNPWRAHAIACDLVNSAPVNQRRQVKDQIHHLD